MYDLNRVAFWALTIFVFAIPWERNIGIPGLGAAGTLFGGIAFLFGVASVIRGRALTLRAPSVLLVLMVVFSLWSTVGYYWSIDPGTTVGRTITYVQLTLMVWLVWQLCRSDRDFRVLLQAFVLGAMFAIAVVIVNFVRGEATLVSEFTGLSRFSFAGGDPNYFALALAMAIPMAWHLILREQRRVATIMNVAYLPLAVIAIGLTGSRGGAISAFVALSIIPLTYVSLGFWRQVVMWTALGVTAFGAIYVIPEATIDRFLETPETLVEDDLQGRVGIWQAGLHVLAEHDNAFAFGVGSGNFRFAVESRLGDARTAHNAYLNLWVDNGIIGLTVFLSFFVVSILPFVVHRTKSRALAMVLMACLGIGIFALSWEKEKALWLAFALLTSHRAIVLAPSTSSSDDSFHLGSDRLA